MLGQPLRTLSGGQRRRVELARILFSGADTLLLDEPTNHLDADSIVWLRDFLRGHRGGLVVISHDVELLELTVNKVFHLDATRGRARRLQRRLEGATCAARDRRAAAQARARQRREEGRRAQRAGRPDAREGDQGGRRAADGQARRRSCSPGSRTCGRPTRSPSCASPSPAPCGRVPLTAAELSKSYGSLEVFTDVDLAIDRGSRVVVLGLNGAGKTTLLRILAGVEPPDTGEVDPGHGLRLGYYAQEHETLDPTASVLANLASASPDLPEVEQRKVLGSFLFSGDTAQTAAGTLSGGEKTRLALARLVVSSANVLLLDEPTNNLDPASRDQVLGALRSYRGAIVLVTHDEGAVAALDPQRVLLLPDGVEDHWSAELADLVALA